MRGILVSIAMAAIAVGTASAQQIQAAAPAGSGQAVGTVTVLPTPEGSVLVLRGGQVYQLRAGDAIFVGDTVFTRTNGTLRFTVSGCDVGIGGQSQFVVPQGPLTCPTGVLTAGTLLDYSAQVAGVAVGVGGPGATPLIAPLLLGGVAGGAALASNGGNSASP